VYVYVPGWGTASQCARTPWRRAAAGGDLRLRLRRRGGGGGPGEVVWDCGSAGRLVREREGEEIKGVR
jgi:hypothetical protein